MIHQDIAGSSLHATKISQQTTNQVSLRYYQVHGTFELNDNGVHVVHFFFKYRWSGHTHLSSVILLRTHTMGELRCKQSSPFLMLLEA